MAKVGHPADTVRLVGWGRGLWHRAMDGQVSPAAEAANRRLYAMRAALAARRAANEALHTASHSDVVTSGRAAHDTCCPGVASSATPRAARPPGAADAVPDDEAAGRVGRGGATSTSHSQELVGLYAGHAAPLDRHLTELCSADAAASAVG